MLSTVHMMTGAAVGVATENWWATTIGCVVLHFLWDMLPHWDPSYKTWKKRDWHIAAAVDLLMGLGLILYVTGGYLNVYIVVGVIMSILPDLLTLAYKLLKIKLLEPLVQWHDKIQNRASGWWGLFFQVVVAVIMTVIIRLKS
ncbi:MAG TPA: hypothetical protein PLH65_01745 [bacterium]|nr:hypothetical protein [bacterium]